MSAPATHGHGHGHGHTHDGIDWAERLEHLRAIDALDRDTHREVAARLAADLPAGATVVDVGSGAGGMSAAFARALAAAGGGRVVLVDAVPALLEAAAAHVRSEVEAAAHIRSESAAATQARSEAGPAVLVRSGGGAAERMRFEIGGVEVAPVLADAADPALPDLVPAGDLVWASGVVHHLPDQQRGVNTLATVVRPGGRLALREGGLSMQCLPWDLGLGEPGLQGRLTAVRDTWFVRMRADMPDAVRMPGGWGRTLTTAGLRDVTSFSYLIDHPAPAPAPVRESVVDWLTLVADVGAEWLADADRATVARLLDQADPEYVGNRDDVFVLGASTVHYGTRPEPPA